MQASIQNRRQQCEPAAVQSPYIDSDGPGKGRQKLDSGSLIDAKITHTYMCCNVVIPE